MPSLQRSKPRLWEVKSLLKATRMWAVGPGFTLKECDSRAHPCTPAASARHTLSTERKAIFPGPKAEHSLLLQMPRWILLPRLSMRLITAAKVSIDEIRQLEEPQDHVTIEEKRKRPFRVEGWREASPQVSPEGRMSEIPRSREERNRFPGRRQCEQMPSSEKGELGGKDYVCCLHLPDICSLWDWWKLVRNSSSPVNLELVGWKPGIARVTTERGLPERGPTPRARGPRARRRSDHNYLAPGASRTCNRSVLRLHHEWANTVFLFKPVWVGFQSLATEA